MKLFKQQNIALGSDAIITLISSEPTAYIDALFSSIWQRIYAFEKQFSRFLPTSELSMFNHSAGTKMPASEAFIEILKCARDLSIQTGGLFNPFVLPALQRAGYTQSFVKGAETDVHEDHSHERVVSIDHLELGSDWVRIPYGTSIELGGCGKGYLADRLSEYIGTKVSGYSISLGGDILCRGHDDNGANFSVVIQKALQHSEDIVGEIIMPAKPYAVASSGTYLRRGSEKGKAWHHIIDPRTQKPADSDLVLATICHEKAVYADVLASCSVILGYSSSIPFLKKFDVSDALFQLGSNEQLGEIKQFGKKIRLLEK